MILNICMRQVKLTQYLVDIVRDYIKIQFMYN
jgi:hypothetical protein